MNTLFHTHSFRNVAAALFGLLLVVGCRNGNNNDGNRANQVLSAAPVVDDALFALGEALFFDKILSGNRDVACASCHHPDIGSDDDLPLSRGVGAMGRGPQRRGGFLISRNAPALFNLHEYETMFWDSSIEIDNGVLHTPAGELPDEMEAVLRFPVVGAQALFPVISREEMRGRPGDNELADFADDDYQGIWNAVMARLGEHPEYVGMFESAYPGTSFAEMTFAHAANAISGYEVRAFEAIDTPFQRFLEGDESAMSQDAIAGRRAFLNADCNECHSGPLLSDFRHHNTGLIQFGPGKHSGREDLGREGVTGDPDDRYEFRTSPLINIRDTGPYGHAGQFATLESFIEHYHDADDALRDYVIGENVDDQTLWDTELDNREAIIAGIDNDVEDTPRLNAEAIAAFLREASTTSPNLPQVPSSVPSGLLVD